MKKSYQNPSGDLKKGKELLLIVGLHHKKNTPAFNPEFLLMDPIVGHKPSMRIFFPQNNGFKLLDGEEWNASVLRYKIPGKETSDRLRHAHVYVYINVLGREEEKRCWLDETAGKWVEQKYSGKKIISTNFFPYTMEEKKYKKNNDIIIMKEIVVAGGVVKRSIISLLDVHMVIAEIAGVSKEVNVKKIKNNFNKELNSLPACPSE